MPRTCGNFSLTLDDRSRLDIRVTSVRVNNRVMSVTGFQDSTNFLVPRTCGNFSLTLDDRSRLDIRVTSVRVNNRVMSVTGFQDSCTN